VKGTRAIPTVMSVTQWRAGRDRKDGRMSIEMTFSDHAEARAWATWLMDRDARREAEDRDAKREAEAGNTTIAPLQ
jgi:hypothetical protein